MRSVLPLRLCQKGSKFRISETGVVSLPSAWAACSRTPARPRVRRAYFAVLRALLSRCRSERSAQLFGSCLCPLPFHGLSRFFQLTLIAEGEGILDRQDGVPETAVALETVSGDDLRPLCSDETVLLQCGNIFCHGIDRDAQLPCDGGVADDALVGAAVFDAEQVGVDVDLHVVQSQIKDCVGNGKEILDGVLLHIGRVQHSDAPFVCAVIHSYSKWQAAYTAAYAEALAAGSDETTAAYTAYGAAMNSGIVLPGSMVLTGYNYNVRNINDLTYNGVTAENGVFPLYAAPINICTIQGTYDEFSGLLWGVEDSSQYTTSFKFAYGTGGATNVPSGTYFMYGDASATPLTREEAVTAAASAAVTMKPIRAAYSFNGTHSDTYYDETAIGYGIDFFDITLRGGVATIAPTEQVWHGRAACGLIGLIATLVAFVALALTLLRVPFFSTIVRPAAPSISTVHGAKGVIGYIIPYIIFLLPAPLLYYWLIGYPYYMQPQWFKFLTKFMPNSFFNMAPMNSLMLFNGVVGGVFLVLYLLVFFLIGRKKGANLETTGLKLPFTQILKSLLLAVLSFAGIYAVVYACSALSGTNFSFFKFNIMPMDSTHWVAFFKYLPVWLLFFLLCGVIYNSLTRINNAPAWLNYLLCAVVSCGGLAMMFAYDYGKLFATGVRGIQYIPGTTSPEWLAAVGMSFPTALAGIMLFGLLFILPITAVMSRVLHKKTGSVWLGGFLTAFIVLVFTISHMVVSI